jgi:hypothetical protein
MLGGLYRCVVRLHPSSFRRRFGDEMLYIFEKQEGPLASVRVMLDGVLSLFRQWIWRPHTGMDHLAAPASGPAADHIPSFGSLEVSRPRTSAIMHGVIFSLMLFWLVVFAIPYSGIYILHIHIPEVAIDRDAQVQPASLPSHSVWLQLDPYVGEYISHAPPAKISIRIDGDHLALGLAGGTTLALSPMSSTRFIVDGVANDYVDFTSDGQDRICCLSLVIGGKAITARRQ